MKIYANGFGHIATMPIYDKNPFYGKKLKTLKNLLQNMKVNDLGNY